MKRLFFTSWRKLAVIFLTSGGLLLVEGMLAREEFETALVLLVIAALYLLLGMAGLVMMFVKKDRQAFTSEDWRGFRGRLDHQCLAGLLLLAGCCFQLVQHAAAGSDVSRWPAPGHLVC